jgi:cobalt-zinc-cadmium efflux system outer membrane protein
MFTQRVRPLVAVGFAVAALAFASPSMAIEPVAEPAPSYEDLIARLDALPSTLEAVARYDAAVARAEQARALPNPSIAYDRENVYGTGPYNGVGNAETTLTINQPLACDANRLAGRSRPGWRWPTPKPKPRHGATTSRPRPFR